jgi:hypothetical protein
MSAAALSEVVVVLVNVLQWRYHQLFCMVRRSVLKT